MGILNPGSWGGLELAIVIALLLLLFGPRQLPKLARSIGESFRGLKDGMREARDLGESLLDESKDSSKIEDSSKGEKKGL